MKTCLSCHAEIHGESWSCNDCDWSPEIQLGVTLFAPHISGATESYDPAWYDELAILEEDNFWFVARNRLLRWLSRNHMSSAQGKYMEVGCGTGFVLRMTTHAFPNWKIFATEAQPESFEFVRKRVSGDVEFYQMDACAIPFKEEFEAIGAFDVIEHIKDDEGAIRSIHNALKEGGFFFVSVPQHMFLWSDLDEAACHFRRYSKPELEAKLRDAGFEVRLSTSFNSLLLPLMLLSRRRKKKSKTDDKDLMPELRLPKLLNQALSAVLWIEFQLIRLGIRFPVGGSRIVVAQKPVDTRNG